MSLLKFSELEPFDKALEVLSFAGVLLSVGLTISGYSELTQSIPIHFDTNGLPDGFGNKSTIFLVLAILLFIYLFLTLISGIRPRKSFKQGQKTEQAENYHRIAMRMLRAVKVLTVWIFTYMLFVIIQVGVSKASGLGSGFSIISSGLLFAVMGYYVFRMILLK